MLPPGWRKVALTPLSVPARVKANGVCGPPVLMNPYCGPGRVVSTGEACLARNCRPSQGNRPFVTLLRSGIATNASGAEFLAFGLPRALSGLDHRTSGWRRRGDRDRTSQDIRNTTGCRCWTSLFAALELARLRVSPPQG